jgi:hypothetical protein
MNAKLQIILAAIATLIVIAGIILIWVAAFNEFNKARLENKKKPCWRKS